MHSRPIYAYRYIDRGTHTLAMIELDELWIPKLASDSGNVTADPERLPGNASFVFMRAHMYCTCVHSI